MSNKKDVDEEFAHRLRGVIGNESVRGFALRAGLSAPAVHGYLNGTDPGRQALSAMARAGRVSGGYLAFGDPEPHSTFLLPGGLPQDAGDAVVVPAYASDESATIAGYVSLSKSWLSVMFRTAPERLRLFSQVHGLDAGDLGLGELMTDGTVGGDGTYVVVAGDRLAARIIQRLPGGKVQVKSRSPDFEPVTVAEARIADAGLRIVARLLLVWSARTV